MSTLYLLSFYQAVSFRCVQLRTTLSRGFGGVVVRLLAFRLQGFEFDPQ